MSMNQKNIKIPAIPEILTSFVSREAQTEELKNDPKSYIMSRYNADLADNVECAVVQNSVGTLHLALPYYSGLDAPQAAVQLNANELEDIQGGEVIYILTTVFIVSLAAIGIGSTAAGIAVGADVGSEGK